MVKLADRIVNLQPPPGHWTREKRAASLDEAGLILARLGEASQSLAGRLGQKMRDDEQYCR